MRAKSWPPFAASSAAVRVASYPPQSAPVKMPYLQQDGSSQPQKQPQQQQVKPLSTPHGTVASAEDPLSQVASRSYSLRNIGSPVLASHPFSRRLNSLGRPVDDERKSKAWKPRPKSKTDSLPCELVKPNTSLFKKLTASDYEAMAILAGEPVNTPLSAEEKTSTTKALSKQYVAAAPAPEKPRDTEPATKVVPESRQNAVRQEQTPDMAYAHDMKREVPIKQTQPTDKRSKPTSVEFPRKEVEINAEKTTLNPEKVTTTAPKLSKRVAVGTEKEKIKSQTQRKKSPLKSTSRSQPDADLAEAELENVESAKKSRSKKAGPPPLWNSVFPTPTSHPENGLDWTISDNVFTSALKASKQGEKTGLYSHHLYSKRNADGSMSKVTVHYCCTAQETEDVCQKYFLNQPALGFDLEWEMNASYYQGAKQNVSLIQIASPGHIGLFHVALFPERLPTVPPSLKKILEDPNVLKCGVWIVGDFSRLKTFLKLNPQGALDMSHYHNLILFCKSGKVGQVPKKALRLKDQVEQVIGLPLDKGEVRTSAWSTKLTSEQIQYSCSDVYAGLQLFAIYEQQRKLLNPCPDRPPLGELQRPIKIAVASLENDGILPAEEEAFAEAQREWELAASAAALQ